MMGPLARAADAGPFDVVLCDPPWHYDDKGSAGARGATYQYPVMAEHFLCGLDVPAICAPNAACFMWTTGPQLPTALGLLDAWGFSYVTMAFLWRKIYASGRPVTGMGHHTRSCYEYVVLGRRGRGLARVDAGIHQEVEEDAPACVECPTGAHSAKPREVARRIQRLYGPQRRVELFSREVVDGWHGIGLDYPGDGRDIRAVLGMRAQADQPALPVRRAAAQK